MLCRTKLKIQVTQVAANLKKKTKFKKKQKMKWRRRWVVSITFLYKILGESDHLTDQ